VTSSEHTFVFADLAGYTALTEAHGDDDAATVATSFHALARECLVDGASLVKTIGDAVMLVAPSIEVGLRLALRISWAVSARPRFPAVRVGIHVGPAAERDGDYFGAAVNLASRVAAVARGGEIVCTEPVAFIAVAAQIAPARPMGTVRLKNVVMPVALYEVGAGDAIGPLHYIDPVCRMQVAADAAPCTIEHESTLLHFCSPGCVASFRKEPEQYLHPLVGDP
jgi:adenylate cyclase